MNVRELLQRKLFWVTCAAALMVGLPALDDGCGTHEPWHKRRPRAVPSDAVYVPVVKGYWYVRCWLNDTEKVNRCRIYRSDGSILYEDDYLPYDGSGPIPSDLLQISSRTGTHGYIVWLKSGAVLIPRSDFQRQRQFVDWVLGKRTSP